MKIALASFLIQLIDAYTYGLYSQEPDCIVTREEIRMEMTEGKSKWSELKNGVISKQCPVGRDSIYDITFCFVVCQLKVGDPCYPEYGIGDDICEIGTQCDTRTLKCTVASQDMENGADSSIIEYGEYSDWIY